MANPSMNMSGRGAGSGGSSYRTTILQLDESGFPHFLLAFESNKAVKARSDAEKGSALTGSIEPEARSYFSLIPNLQCCPYAEVVQGLRDLFDDLTNRALMRGKFHAIRCEAKEDLMAFKRWLEYTLQDAYACSDMEERNERLAEQFCEAHSPMVLNMYMVLNMSPWREGKVGPNHKWECLSLPLTR